MRFLDESGKKVGVLAIGLAIMVGVSGAAAENLPPVTPDSNSERTDIPGVYQWDLTPLFESDKAWDKARLELIAKAKGLEQYEGKLADPAALNAALGPEQHEFLFFVAREDGTGRHIFTKSFSAHEAVLKKLRGRR